MRTLGMEAINPGFGSELILESLATVIAIEIARHFNSGDAQLRARTHDGRFSDAQMNKIFEFVDATTRGLASQTIAEELGISAAHFRRSFKQTAGKTFHQYVAAPA